MATIGNFSSKRQVKNIVTAQAARIKRIQYTDKKTLLRCLVLSLYPI